PGCPLSVLLPGGLLVARATTSLPGHGGPSPAGGFKLHGPPTAGQLPGVILAALATLCFGMVLGPEMPLIAIGGGLAVLTTPLSRRGGGGPAVYGLVPRPVAPAAPTPPPRVL